MSVACPPFWKGPFIFSAFSGSAAPLFQACSSFFRHGTLFLFNDHAFVGFRGRIGHLVMLVVIVLDLRFAGCGAYRATKNCDHSSYCKNNDFVHLYFTYSFDLSSLRSADDDLIPANVDLVFFKRSRRRTADILAVDGVMSVVARTPDMLEVRPVLHDAVKMCASRGTSF